MWLGHQKISSVGKHTAMRSTAIALGLAALISSTAAKAELITVTFTGTFNGGFGNIFSPVIPFNIPQNRSLFNQPWQSTFVFDTTKGAITSTGPAETTLYGGASYGISSPLVSASMTLNGVIYSFAGGYDDFWSVAAGNFQVQADSADDPAGDGGVVLEAFVKVTRFADA
jgi:hypothetical protein